jgi:TetR/AcrR family fatty acid metabolism transcriptional regulator
LGTNNKKAEATRDRIINSARLLFAEHGYQKTTVMDISKQAGVSEAALYEYFKGKEDLLLTIPGLWISELLSGLEEQLLGIKGAFNKLRKYIWWNMLCVQKSPLNAKIVHMFLKTNASFMETEVYNNVKAFYNYLIDIIEEGKKSREMKADLDPYVARSIVIGTMDYNITRWLLKEQSYSLFDKLDETIDLLEDALAEKTSNAS